ncbi:expressed unknown protein [Seminavis robusta]|uniref:Uncharacterized protein n=1 Tax=Seminavis robusta TaxID=568900 RepID=A0A9N8HBV7_9STRA|nr:expressed unknown protein [Seminavis robusta]|eukprot:Sro197_g083870.1 n/a (117) ;mRNA; r:72039-72427
MSSASSAQEMAEEVTEDRGNPLADNDFTLPPVDTSSSSSEDEDEDEEEAEVTFQAEEEEAEVTFQAEEEEAEVTFQAEEEEAAVTVQAEEEEELEEEDGHLNQCGCGKSSCLSVQH